MGRVKINPIEAGTKLLARDRYSSIKHKSFLFDFMEYMSEDGLNLDTKEAQKIYEYFDGAIQRTLENGELELFERDEQPEEPVPAPEPDDGTDDKPQEDPGMTNPDDPPGKPNALDAALAAINYIDSRYKPALKGIAEKEVTSKTSGPYKGYVSGSNVEPEDMGWLEEGEVITPINPFADKSESPNGARHFEKWSEEAKKQSTCSEFQCQMDEVKKAVDNRQKAIESFMLFYDLEYSEAEAVYTHLLDREEDAGKRPPLSDKARKTLHHIKNIVDIVIDL